MNKFLLPKGVEKYWANNVWDRTLFEGSPLGKYFKRQRTLLKKYVLKYRPDSVLILCCGVGVETQMIENMSFVKKIVAIDINKKSCELARKRVKTKKVTIVNGNVYKVRYQEAFDMVVCIDALHHLGNQELILENVYRALKTNGLFVGDYFGEEKFVSWMIKKRGLFMYIYLNCKHHFARLFHYFNVIPKKWIENGWMRSFLFTRSEVREHLTKHSFRVLSLISDEWHFFVARKTETAT